MPYKLIPPAAERRTPYFSVRGSEHGVSIDRSTKTGDRREAQAILKRWRDEAKRSSVLPPEKPGLTFAAAALAYMRSGRSKLFLAPLIRHFGEKPIAEIGQAELDSAAQILGPDRKPQTSNRLVYTPFLAVCRHVGEPKVIKRPKWEGGRRLDWLRPERAFALLSAAEATDVRLHALMVFLLYCGPRLSEALRISWDDVDLAEGTAFIRRTKSGKPLTVALPPEVVSALANLPKRRRVFGLSKCARLYRLLATAETKAGFTLPEGAAFHILRHTHATWRRKFTGADTAALVDTGLWKSRNAAAVYEHFEVSEEARKNALFPTKNMWRARQEHVDFSGTFGKAE
jgi:integrase